MFPFRKPPSKFEIAKKGVSDAVHHMIDAVPTEQIEGKIDDLKKSAALAAISAAEAAHQAGEVAAHKLEELQSVATHLGESVMDAAHNVIGHASEVGHQAARSAQDATQSVRSTVQDSAKNARSAGQTAAASAAAMAAAKTEAAAQSARDIGHQVQESAQAARETLGEKAKTATGFAGTLKDRAAADFKIGGKEAQNAKAIAQKSAEREAAAIKARATATEAKKEAKKQVKNLESIAADKTAEVKAALDAQKAPIRDAAAVLAATAQTIKDKTTETGAAAGAAALELAEKVQHKVTKEGTEIAAAQHGNDGTSAEIQIAESASKWGWIIFGLVIGAVLALLFAPTSGRRSRAAIKDRLGKVGDGAVDAATATSDKVVDIAHRVEGLAHKVEAKIASDSEGDDDGTVADRVRSILGHHEVARNIERLNIDCAEGIITLRGPLLDEATQQMLVSAVKTVPGVKDVVPDFLTDEAPEDPAKSVI